MCYDFTADTFTAWADAGVDPIDFPEAPTVALPKALEKANLTIDDISLFELNEAFSVVVRIAEKACNIDPAKINVNGYDPFALLLSLVLMQFAEIVELLLWVMPSETLARVSLFRSFTPSSLVNTVPPVFAMG